MAPWLALLLGLLVAAGCSHELHEGPAPSLEADQEATFCGGFDTTFTLRGSGFSPLVVEAATEDARVELPGVCFERVEDLEGNPISGEAVVCLPEDRVTWISQSEMSFTVGSDLGLAPGVYEVIVRNPDGQEARGGMRLRIRESGPLVFWADPAVTYNGLTVITTVYGTGLGGAVQEIQLRDEAGVSETIDFAVDEDNPNRFRATIAAATAPGLYDIVVRDAEGCEAALEQGLRVTDQLTLQLDAIDPQFGDRNQTTPVTITGSGLQSVPRVYLNPTAGDAMTVATALQSVAFIDATRLTAVVPEGLPTGSYDVFVVNPDGAAGLLSGAFTVVADPPPTVDAITPSSVDNGDNHTVTVEGTGFRTPSVTTTCRAPDGTVTEGDAPVPTSSATELEATLPTLGLPAGTVCVVRVTNADGSYVDFSAVGITLPSANLAPFQPATELTTARRAPAVTAARATRAARFLYAIGGDGGSDDSALASVEAAAVDIFGAPGDWFELPVPLPQARTRAGVARIGDFVYVVGGHDGSAATDGVLRAEILDPLDAPVIRDVTARRGEGAGIGAGVWYYRVSAVMADDDPDNPGGETLASDPLGVSLPATLQDTLALTLYWDPVPGAQGYRVYRSPQPDLTFGSELLLAEIDGAATTLYEDAASAPPAGASPRPLGATGEWVAQPALGTARSSAGVGAVRDPADPTVWYLYAMGGRDAGGGDLASWERLAVTIGADGHHTAASAWTAGEAPLSAARSELGLWTVTRLQAPLVAANTVVYAGGGAGSTNVDAAIVQPGGALSPWTAVDAMSPPRQGYGAIAGAGFLFAFGGVGDDNGVSNELEAPVGGAPPTLRNWNNEGNKLTRPRHLPGATRESAFIYIIGGESGGAATPTTERTVL